MNPDWTSDEAVQVWQILVEECGAYDEVAGDFDYWWTHDHAGTQEYRFQGKLGFGGKVYVETYNRRSGGLRVSCYREDETPERRVMVDQANERLTALAAQLGGRVVET